jgi:hypothetical protein
MELPNPIEIRNDISKVIENVDFLVEFLSTKDKVSFSEFNSQWHTINLELLNIWHRIYYLTMTDRKYSKAHEKLRKILIKMLIDTNEIEKKHSKGRSIFWESIFQQGKYRKDLINHFKDVSKQLEKIHKSI